MLTYLALLNNVAQDIQLSVLPIGFRDGDHFSCRKFRRLDHLTLSSESMAYIIKG